MSLLSEILEYTPSPRLKFELSLRLVVVGEAHLLAGRVEDALALTRHALERSREHKERGHQSYALHLLGEIAERSDPPDTGEAEERRG
jgi:ATP/maltotriose-dependent transcriptional regulator MalT